MMNILTFDLARDRLHASRLTGARAETKDIVDTAVAAGLVQDAGQGAEAADLVGTLKGPGPLPSSPRPTRRSRSCRPARWKLLKPENKAKLQRILTYHVVAGKVMAADVVKLSRPRPSAATRSKSATHDGTVTVDNARVVKTDIVASNGVIHVIDTVMLPTGE